MAEITKDKVCAVVVTFNRRELLVRCIEALEAQSHAVDCILVIDNASTDGTGDLLREWEQKNPAVKLLTLRTNVGGSGGFYAGMKWAHENGFDWLWLMDDDGVPAPDCLEKLRARAGSPEDLAVAVPMQRDTSGRVYGFAVWNGHEVDVTEQIEAGEAMPAGEPVFHFVGPLVSRALINAIGLPIRDFFIWFDDIEWALRAQRKAGARVEFVADAVFAHNMGGAPKEVFFLGRRSVRGHQPAWKTYYGTRNSLYALSRGGKGWKEAGLGFFVLEFRHLFGDVMYEPDRAARVKMRLRGMRDGALGRLGKRH